MPTTDDYIQAIRGQLQQGNIPELDPKQLPPEISFSQIQSAITKDYQDAILQARKQGKTVSLDPVKLPAFVNQEALDVTMGKIPAGFSASQVTKAQEVAHSELPNILPTVEQAKTALQVAAKVVNVPLAGISGLIGVATGRPQAEVVASVEQGKTPSQTLAELVSEKRVGLVGSIAMGLAGEALDVLGSPISLIPIPATKLATAGIEFLARKEVPALGKAAEQLLRPIEVEVPKLLGSKVAGAITSPKDIKITLGEVPKRVAPPELPFIPPAPLVETPKPGFGKTEGEVPVISQEWKWRYVDAENGRVVETDTVQPRVTEQQKIRASMTTERLATPTPPSVQVSAKLPPDLARSAPRFGFGAKQFQLAFDSDIDKAMLITAQPTPSSRDSDFRAFLLRQGFSDNDIRRGGQIVKARIKELAKKTEIPSGTRTGQLNLSPIISSPSQGTFQEVAPPFVETSRITRPPIPDLQNRLPTPDQRTLAALTTERTRLNSLLQVTRSPKLREMTAQRMKSVDFQIRRLDRANGGTSDPAPDTVSQDQARPEFQEAQAILTPVKRLDTIILGKADREPPNLKRELDDLLTRVDERQPRPIGFLENTKALLDHVRQQGSPNVVLDRDPTLKTLSRFAAHRDAAGSRFLNNLLTEFRVQVPFQEGSNEALQLGKLLDTYEQLPAEVATSLPKNVVTAFQWMRGKWKTLAELVNQEIPGTLPLERRIKAYVFRLSRQEDILQAWKDDAAALTLKGDLTPIEKSQAERLKTALKAWTERGVILYDIVPRSIHVPFLESRISLDAPETIDGVKAFSTYAGLVRRKVFDEAVIREGLPMLSQVTNPAFREYGRWYLRNYVGMERHNRALSNLSRSLTGLEYLKDLGFNTVSAVNNATQQLNTVAEIGPLWTERGFIAHATRDPRWERLWEQSQHFQDVDTLMNTYSGYWGNATKSFRDLAMWVFNQVELTNRRSAFFGAYQQGIAEGKKIQQVAEFLRRGASSEDAALLYADDVVSKTQFVYGRIGTPRLLTQPSGRLLFQFGTFPIKQTELFVDWAKNNPKKLLSYLLWSGGTKWAAKSLGVDLSNALGVGVDFTDLLRAARDLSRGEPETAKLRVKLAATQLATGSGTGILPQGIFPVYATAKAVFDRGAGQLLGVQPARLINAANAIAEGQVTLPVPGPEGGPPLVMKQGYPLREFGTGRLSRILTAKELAIRTFIAQPVDPGRERVLRQEVIDRHVKALQREAAIAIIDKDIVKRDRIIRELQALGQPISAGLVKGEALRRVLPTFTRQTLREIKMTPAEQRLQESGRP